MREFWKNEWELFLEDLNDAKEFLFQPVTFGSQQDLMLRPSAGEVIEKADTTSFWRNEWNLFMQDLNNVKEFLFQPVTFK